ncbi:sulfur carrier protein ThiS [Sphingomonas sinipercae]|uniref:Sulfur carrier protein ThiS n=1 Tax=Sphingomonas sinipercae TaxID=2714944 RepID=A0A6G7ZPQ4_9SPHN|nr:sulfur carrier protein ThiS [Sphingomonas sinipercae]
MTATASSQSLTVQVNGQTHRIAPGCTIAAMLSALGIAPERVAVERNREIVPRSTLGDVAVNEGDAFEIVHFVGGG